MQRYADIHKEVQRKDKLRFEEEAKSRAKEFQKNRTVMVLLEQWGLESEAKISARAQKIKAWAPHRSHPPRHIVPAPPRPLGLVTIQFTMFG